jgi:gamma-carbonic anhydrase
MLRPFRGVLPTVDPSAYVDPSAQIIGDVHIGAESSVWMNVVIRGDVHWIRIGARSNVQDGTVIHGQTDTHPVSIGDEVTIGHGAIVHGCTITDRCLIGMGAILLNGVRVGSESIVAAGSLLVEGFVVPPRSLVMGSPATVRRAVGDLEAAAIRESANRYLENGRTYAAHGLWPGSDHGR